MDGAKEDRVVMRCEGCEDGSLVGSDEGRRSIVLLKEYDADCLDGSFEGCDDGCFEVRVEGELEGKEEGFGMG